MWALYVDQEPITCPDMFQIGPSIWPCKAKNGQIGIKGRHQYLICVIGKIGISMEGRRYQKNKTTILPRFERSFKEAYFFNSLFFHLIGTCSVDIYEKGR